MSRFEHLLTFLKKRIINFDVLARTMVLQKNLKLILDIDECESNDNSCDNSKETCENSDGSYICNCVGGYRKLNQQCNGKN